MRAKKNLIFIFLLIITTVYSQEYNHKSSFRNFFKIEIFLDKIALGYEIPLDHKFLMDFSAGIGAANDFREGNVGIKWAENNTSYLGPFLKGEMRYYFNRNNREKRGHSLTNNAGSYVGLQSKFNFNGNKDIGQVLLSELHFGQQLPISKSLFLRYHAGVGYGYNFGEKYSSVYPAIGLVLGYAF